MYIAMAQGSPFDFHIAPYGWRVLGPALVWAMPFSTQPRVPGRDASSACGGPASRCGCCCGGWGSIAGPGDRRAAAVLRARLRDQVDAVRLLADRPAGVPAGDVRGAVRAVGRDVGVRGVPRGRRAREGERDLRRAARLHAATRGACGTRRSPSETVAATLAGRGRAGRACTSASRSGTPTPRTSPSSRGRSGTTSSRTTRTASVLHHDRGRAAPPLARDADPRGVGVRPGRAGAGGVGAPQPLGPARSRLRALPFLVLV